MPFRGKNNPLKSIKNFIKKSQIVTLRGLFFLVFLTGCDAFSAGGRAVAGRGAAELVETEATSSRPLDSLRTLVMRRLKVDEDGDWPRNKNKTKTLHVLHMN